MEMKFSDRIFNQRGDSQTIKVSVRPSYTGAGTDTENLEKTILITVFDGWDNEPKGEQKILISKEQSLKLLLMLQKIHY